MPNPAPSRKTRKGQRVGRTRRGAAMPLDRPLSPNSKPCFGLTLGDPAGIGPEVAVRAALSEEVRDVCRPMLVGPLATVKMVAALIDKDIRVHRLVDGSYPPDEVHENEVYAHAVPLNGKVHTGEASAAGGRAAYSSLLWAIDKALGGQIDAIVTAPLNKASLRKAGVELPGHTEILAERCGVEPDDVAMMLYLPPGDPAVGANGLGVAHVTLHQSVATVADCLTTPAILAKILLLDEFLKNTGVAKPRIAVAALNPHGGEAGLFGTEEDEVIRPAVEDAGNSGVIAEGPLPVDTLFRRTLAGREFDGVVCMYHDQGHIPIKLVAFDRAVNVTLGLPIVRTSPSHGTAYDIAWTGHADARGMIAAALTADRLYRYSRVKQAG